MGILDLITILETETKPSRQLDAQIYCALHRSAYADETPQQHYAHALANCPWYTSSIDAALQLMRKHYLWQLKQGIECTAIVWWIEHDWDDIGAPTGRSTTHPALALVTATLIARAIEDRVKPSPIGIDQP